jgi:predicted nucleotidyltransferase
MNTIRDDILKEIIKRVVDVAHPESIIMFGSAARGEMGPNSDVDLLVIKNGEYDQRGYIHESSWHKAGCGCDPRYTRAS